MIKILANDGLHPDGIAMLEAAGMTVDTQKISQEDLMTRLNDYDVICVRSATKVRTELIDACPNLKIIARGGVGLDNIDVTHARAKGVAVINTPAASSESVAELVFGHFINIARSIHLGNREMPGQGDSQFKNLKKAYSKKGAQLRGKNLGIVGFGRIGVETARMGLGLGMNVLAVDPMIDSRAIGLYVYGVAEPVYMAEVKTVPMDEMLAKSDFISIHVPSTDKPVLGKEEINKMKDGVILVNAARGGSIDEDALLSGIDGGKILGVGLDVFLNEPTPRKEILDNDSISLSPHTGASTQEAQSNIGTELAKQIIDILG